MENKIRQKRKEMGMNQEQLAERCRIAQTTVSAIERGQVIPNVYTAIRIAKALRSCVEKLFLETEDRGENV